MNTNTQAQHPSQAEANQDRFSPEWLKSKFSELMKNSPAGDLERNLRAFMNQSAQQMGLVTREEFDVRVELIDRLAARVATLEAELENIRK
jgi:ubiquinone biosynthesis accessory factor UbiK